MKALRNLLIIILYSIIIIGFGFWWTMNFDRFLDFKGDESIFEVVFACIITILCGIVLKIITKRLSWLFVVVIPFAVGLLSGLITFFMPLTGLIKGTTLENLRLYGIVYTLVIIGIVIIKLRLENRTLTNHV